MKTLKIITIGFAIALICLIGYANFTYLSPAKKLERAQLMSFHLRGNYSADEQNSLEKKLAETPGISACSIGKEGDVASVVFKPEKISIATIKKILSAAGRIEVSEKELSTSGGCPIHKVNASFGRLISALDLRNF